MTDAEKIARLETLVVFLAKGILAHEYAKDLGRDSVEFVLREIASEDLNAAMDKAKSEEYYE